MTARVITLLESIGKIFARILLNRPIINIYPLVIPKAQSGFRAGRATMDMIFLVRQPQENCIEQRVPLYQIFVDLFKRLLIPVDYDAFASLVTLPFL